MGVDAGIEKEKRKKDADNENNCVGVDVGIEKEKRKFDADNENNCDGNEEREDVGGC